MTAAIVVVAALVGAACGWGALVLGLSGADRRMESLERWAWAFPLGMGVLGWVVFPLCLVFGVGTLALWSAVIPGLAGLAMLPRPTLPRRLPTDPWMWLLLAAALALAAGDLAEALSPPADADSLAYHFALPKEFLRLGHIVFTPRAVDGAVPMLLHMTYLAALGLGGEIALTLWCGISGWAVALIAYAFARRHVGAPWALAAALLVQSLPAVLYGGGSGQVEVRLAALTLLALAAAARARQQGDIRFAVIAGLAAGFCFATKYPGLLVVGCCGLMLLWQRRPTAMVAAFTTTAVLAGGQWLVWHWAQIGDPIFPLLYGILPYGPQVPWNTDMAAAVREFIIAEKPLPPTLANLIRYPLLATFDPLQEFEASRTGFGPSAVLLVPFAFAGWWQRPRAALASPLFAIMAACGVGYVVWFLGGPSQRVRHLLPLLVPALLILVIAAQRATAAWPALKPAVVASIITVLGLQLGGQAVFAAQYVRHLLSGESREAFLTRQIAYEPVVDWINGHLGPTDKVMIGLRETVYLIDIPVFLTHGAFEGRIETHSHATDPARFWHQMRAEGITHMVVESPPADAPIPPSQALLALGCLRLVTTIDTAAQPLSRTLGMASTGREGHQVLQLTPERCPL